MRESTISRRHAYELRHVSSALNLPPPPPAHLNVLVQVGGAKIITHAESCAGASKGWSESDEGLSMNSMTSLLGNSKAKEEVCWSDAASYEEIASGTSVERILKLPHRVDYALGRQPAVRAVTTHDGRRSCFIHRTGWRCLG